MGSFVQENYSREVISRLFKIFKVVAEKIAVFYVTSKKEQWKN